MWSNPQFSVDLYGGPSLPIKKQKKDNKTKKNK